MKLVFATHNEHKFQEIKALMPDYIELLSLNDIDCNEEIEETGNTIDQNAVLKVQHVNYHYHYNCFADDTGLEIDELGNEPGVYSARYAGEEKSDEANIQKVLKKLKGKINRKARFKTVIALIIDEQETLFTGTCEGEITTEKQGEKGFGYDPIFKPKDFDRTFAEMSQEEKNKISHRGKAMRQLLDYLSE